MVLECILELVAALTKLRQEIFPRRINLLSDTVMQLEEIEIAMTAKGLASAEAASSRMTA